ncbi:MAG: excinuclease ABC subunit UvrC [Mariprofundales bacterium]|nr:excinuclease ABC subunit UvrC [Mariprofundales bacterium]
MWIEPPLDLSAIPREPGVYRMCNGEGTVIYIGKARNLVRRVSSYFQRMPESPRTQAMVQQVREIQLTVTASEAEALLLEHNLIKQIKPRYNVLLKDAKSYPWIVLTSELFPRLLLYRGNHHGKRKHDGDYFGPFPNAGAVRQTLQVMQKVFALRDCDEATFRSRSRPCMQHQIGRCSAPCVNRVDQAAYRKQVEEARQFLRGRSPKLLEAWQQEMEQAAARMAFERAALLRDRIRMLRSVVSSEHADDLPPDADAITLLRQSGGVLAAIGVRRGGRDLGVQTVEVKQALDAEDSEVLHSLLLARYHQERPPALILLEAEPTTVEMMKDLIKVLVLGKTIRVEAPQRGARLEWLAKVRHSAERTLAAMGEGDQRPAFIALAELLGLDGVPERIAAVDNAHLGGQQMVAAITFADHAGAEKKNYRHYRLQGVPPADDYAAMAAVLDRFFRAIDEGVMPCPDLMLIDGGRGQLAVAKQAAADHGLSQLKLVAVSKGAERKVGNEQLWRAWLGSDQSPLSPGRHSPALLLIARVRDEAHRFAGRYMRKRKQQGMFTSALDAIPGIGKQRRMQLLSHFGGIQGVRAASRKQLVDAPGIATKLAEAIFMAMRD